MHTTDLRCILQSYTALNGATMHHNERGSVICSNIPTVTVMLMQYIGNGNANVVDLGPDPLDP